MSEGAAADEKRPDIWDLTEAQDGFWAADRAGDVEAGRVHIAELHRIRDAGASIGWLAMKSLLEMGVKARTDELLSAIVRVVKTKPPLPLGHGVTVEELAAAKQG